jgi:hypothetical protein
MTAAVPNENTLFGIELKFVIIIRAKIRPTSTPKNPQKRIVTVTAKETLHGSLGTDDFTGKAIDEMNGSKKSLIPIFEWHGCICKKGQTNLNNVSMFALSRAILLMCMWTRYKMSYPYSLEEGIKLLILSSPIRLHSNNFLIKETFNMMLKIMKFLKHIRFLFQKIYLSEFAIIINKTHIVLISTKRFRGRAPNIRKYKFKRRSRHTR